MARSRLALITCAAVSACIPAQAPRLFAERQFFGCTVAGLHAYNAPTAPALAVTLDTTLLTPDGNERRLHAAGAAPVGPRSAWVMLSDGLDIDVTLADNEAVSADYRVQRRGAKLVGVVHYFTGPGSSEAIRMAGHHYRVELSITCERAT